LELLKKFDKKFKENLIEKPDTIAGTFLRGYNQAIVNVRSWIIENSGEKTSDQCSKCMYQEIKCPSCDGNTADGHYKCDWCFDGVYLKPVYFCSEHLTKAFVESTSREI